MISKKPFGTMPDGTQVFRWTLTNENGLQAEFLDYGATLRSLIVPDQKGNPVDVVLGFDTLEDYISDDCYLGATVGRFANRIKGASFDLNGQTYRLFTNNGANHLHGGQFGFNKYVWNSRQVGDCVEFSRLSPDGEEGYPGNLQIHITVGWQGNSLTIQYHAETDQDTIVNLTSHGYFNLNGGGDINGHILQIKADRYIVSGGDGIPTGEVAEVTGSAMDFRTPKPIGQDADNDEPCVQAFRGYDSSFVISGHPFAKVVGDETGITMVADTDQPGVHLYTANFLTERKGKGGKDHGFRKGFCLETQHFPDSIHQPQWPSVILRSGEIFRSITSYTFL